MNVSGNFIIEDVASKITLFLRNTILLMGLSLPLPPSTDIDYKFTSIYHGPIQCVSSDYSVVKLYIYIDHKDTFVLLSQVTYSTDIHTPSHSDFRLRKNSLMI